MCVCVSACVFLQQEHTGRQQRADVSVRPLDSSAEQVKKLHSRLFSFTCHSVLHFSSERRQVELQYLGCGLILNAANGL